MQWHVALVGTELGCTAWSMQPGTAVNANALIQEDEFADAKELQSAMHNSESCVTTCLNSLDTCHKMCRTKDLVQCGLNCTTDHSGCTSKCTQAILQEITKSAEKPNAKVAAGAAAERSSETNSRQYLKLST